MGCIARIGCLVLLAVICVLAYLNRDKWLSKVPGASPAVTASSAPVWEPLTQQAGDRGKRAIEALSTSTGPVFTNLRASEVASYVFVTLGHVIPTSADSAEAAIIGDALFVHAIVPVKAIAGSGLLGPLGALLNDRERISLGGSFRVVRPGLSEFQVREIKVRDFKVPSGAIPRLIEQLTKGNRPAGLSPNGLPVPTPNTLADVRIANRQVTLYKSTPGAVP